MAQARLLFLIFLLVGCDRPSAPSAAPMEPARAAVQIKLITQLPPNRTVHAAVDELGNIHYVVETENGQDGAIVVGDSGIPRATQLTSANILAALGETVGGNGNIQDLATGPDGGIYFCFIGGKNRAVRACIGRFFLKNESIQIIYDTKQILALSGMGDSIDLARGTLVPVRDRMYLLLRHSDAWTVLRFAASRNAPGIDSRIERAFTKVIFDGEALDLSRTRYDLAPGPGETMFLLDRMTGILMQVDREGQATHRAFLTGLPSEMSLPVATKQNQITLFAADSAMIEADVDDRVLRRRLPRTSYPALIQIDEKEFSAIGRDDLRVPSGFPAYSIRIHKLLPAPGQSFVAYDLSSGQFMRLKLVVAP